MTDDGTGFAEGETEESGDQLAQSLTPETGGLPGQSGPQTLIPERGELPEHLTQSLAAEPSEVPEQPEPQTLIPERGELHERPADS